MPDILNDPPSTYQLPPVGAWEDNTNHNEAQLALLAFNELAFGQRGAPGLTVRSVAEDGAVADGTDQLARFQTTVDTVAAVGGGIALVPLGTFVLHGTLTIPAKVILSGLGDRSIIRGIPNEDQPQAIRFAPGEHRGGVENLQILGEELAKPPVGIDLSGAQFLRLRNIQVWDFQLGICLSDGITSYAGHNHVSDFEINRCHVGILASTHCNQVSVLNGRIWYCRNEGAGTAIDISPPKDLESKEAIPSAEALTIAHVAVENFDLGVRIRGRAHVSLRDVYYEADVPKNPDDPDAPENFFPPGLWMDIQPEKGSAVLMENSIANVSRSRVLGGSLEDAITNDERSHIYNGAKRHHAAAPERNLFENGDFHRSDGQMAGWTKSFGPTFAEIDSDFVTAGRSYDIVQASDPNDAMTTAFTVPETTDYVTVMVRYKNISSASPRFRIDSGVNGALYDDLLPPSKEEWRVAALVVEVDPEAAGVVSVLLAPDLSAKGGRIRVDEVWAVVGATAAPPRAHAHRFEILPVPVTLVKRTKLQADVEFPEIDLTSLQGLGRPPRGVVGAILSLRGTAEPSGLQNPNTIGATLSRAVRPFIRETATGQQWSLDLIYDRVEHDRQVVLRGTSFKDGIKVFNSSMAASYRVLLVGWVLPS